MLLTRESLPQTISDIAALDELLCRPSQALIDDCLLYTSPSPRSEAMNSPTIAPATARIAPTFIPENT